MCGAVQVTLDTQSAAATQTAAPATDIGVSASEVLRGNGTRAGYVLGHGSVMSGSETVYVGVRRARKNIDYTIDYTSGSLFFSEAVSTGESVRVDYRYTESGKSERTVTGPGAMVLRFGPQAQTNLTYSYKTANREQSPDAPDILTYGANTTGKFGTSTVSSMLYISTPQTPNRVSLTSKPTDKKKAAQAVTKDQLMVQSGEFGVGSMRLTVGFQDVGENFAGFQAMRESSAAQADAINQLEKEKGIERLDLGAELKLTGDSKLSFSRGSIEDNKGDISSQSMAYSSGRVRFGFSTREVAKTFCRFKDLRESDRGQLANEAGLSRTQYLLQFKTTRAKDGGWSSFTNTALSGEKGELTYRTASVDLGRVKFEADVRSADQKFTEMKAISDDERSRMALAARQQFDPTAQVSSVVAQDKAQFEKEAGLDRANYRAQYDVGPLWLSLAKSNVSSASGELSRTDYFIKHKAFSLHLGRHRIDPEFGRLASMQPMELKRFGNESGMSRTDMDGQFKLGFGNLDVSHKHVADQQGATVSRDKVNYETKGIEFHANLQSIDPRFSRLADLSDEDKLLLASDLGFRRSDYTIGITALRNVQLKSYFYHSTNSTAGQTREQRKHELTYTGVNGLKLTGLMDDFSYVSDNGVISSYSRRKITFDNKFSLFAGGLLFNGLNDTNTSWDEGGEPVTTEVSQAHFEVNPGGKISYTLDSLQMYLGKGQYENAHAVGFKAKTGKRLSLLGTYSQIDRNKDPENNMAFGLDWSLTKDMHMTANVANRDGGPKGSQQSHQFSFNGTFTQKRLGLENVKVGSAVNTTQLSGKQVACDNGLKVEGKFLRGDFVFDNGDKLNPKNGIYYTSRIISYVSDPDPKKRYHLTYFRQNLITPTNEFARKRNYALSARLNSRMDATASSYFGKNGQNGTVLPVGGGVFKLSYALPGNSALFADYSADLNESTLCRARTTGLGFTKSASNGSCMELYFGWSRLQQKDTTDLDTVFRVKYDHKLNPQRYITLSAQKRSAVDKSAINPHEGKVSASLEFRVTFH